MRPSVRAAFPGFTDRFEGKVPFMYTDSLGLVTTARGDLIDNGPPRYHATDAIGTASPAQACLIPFKLDGSVATVATIAAEWWAVKRAWPAITSVHCATITRLRLTDNDIDTLSFARLDAIWAVLLTRWPDLESWSAPAQLGAISMAWADGPLFKFPKFAAAALRQDWRTCAAECEFTQPPVPVERNRAQVTLFTNAALCTDPDVLAWPSALA